MPALQAGPFRHGGRGSGKVVAITLDAGRSITSLAGTEDDSARPIVACGMLREQAVRLRLNALFRAIPNEAVAVGSTWEASHEETPRDDVVVKRNERGKVGGTAGGETRLSVEVDTTVSGGPEYGGLLRLTGESGPRFVRFDAKAGRVRSVLEGCSLSGVIDGNDSKATVQQWHWTHITVTDDPPKAKK